MSTLDSTAFVPVGSGLTVFTHDEPVEGPVKWLDSPKDVMDFVRGDRVQDTIVLVRGGTTTFLTPALTAGVKGVLTLQGAPESHLGILSREYGIPAIMGVAFERGVRSARGEVIPADGAIVRLDVSSAPQGHVLIEPGAPEAGDDVPTAPPAMDEATMAQIQLLLTKFGGEVPHGSEGDVAFREARLSTDVLQLTDESTARAMTDQEVDDLSAYAGWNMWDCLAARATEGESGLIPRQEYESISFVQIWQRYPEILRFITDEIGVDGVVGLGARAREEIGTKVNLLHAWALGFGVAFGRGVALELGATDDRPEDLRTAFEFQRRLYKRAWGDGPMFTSMRDYRAPLLGQEWIDRFTREKTDLADGDARRLFQLFSASTEMLGFLLHFDNRSGLSDTGPYPTEDGGFVIVRDHFLTDDEVYQWGQVVGEDLPYAVTQAMFFKPDEPLDLQLVDIGTLFTEPANYLKHLTGAAVYARDRWDTPIDQVRLLGDEELRAIQQACDAGSSRLYAHIAAMSKREKIMAGLKVYYADFLLPFARAAGLWDRIVAEFDFFELDPVTSQAYYDLVADGRAAEMIPRLFLTGAGFPPLPAAVEADPAHFEALHALALRGTAKELPGDAEAVEAAGLVASTPGGYLLTEEGTAAHAQLLAAERATLEPGGLDAAYERFLAANGPFKALCAQWQSADADARFELLGQLEDLVERVQPAIRRAAEAVPRLAPYGARLTEAAAAAAEDDSFVLSPAKDSVHTVWMQLHEDLLLTQGISREDEGSY